MASKARGECTHRFFVFVFVFLRERTQSKVKIFRIGDFAEIVVRISFLSFCLSFFFFFKLLSVKESSSSVSLSLYNSSSAFFFFLAGCACLNISATRE